VLRELGTKAAAVVHGPGGIDEIGGEGVTQIASFDADGPRSWTLDPADYGVRASRADIAGGSLKACSEAFQAILSGEDSPRADVVALNAALALHLCGTAPTMRDAYEQARSVQRSGKALLTFVAARGASNG
jgi:anthranilate phosphoribosyltransferase